MNTTIEQLSAHERIKLEFGPALRQIAETLKADIGMGLDLYQIIERTLETRVFQLVRVAEIQAVDESARYWKSEVVRLEAQLATARDNVLNDALAAMADERCNFTPGEGATALAMVQRKIRQLRSEPSTSIPQAERAVIEALLREAADKLESYWWQLLNTNKWHCGRCKGDGKQSTAIVHTPDCLVYRLRQAVQTTGKEG